MSISSFLSGLSAVALGACLAGAAAAQEDVLAPARAGQVQCYEPNIERKTCESLAAYTTGADGVISNLSEVMIMPDPLIIMRLTSPVSLQGAAICGPLRAQDVALATFTINGAAANEADTQSIRTQIAEQMAPMLGAQVCTTYTAQAGGGFVANATFNGAPAPETQRMIWVRPDEGYRVAP